MYVQTAYGSFQRKRLLTVYRIGLLYPFVQAMLYSIGFPHSDYLMETLRPLWLAVMTGCVFGLYYLQPDHLRRIPGALKLLMAAMVWIVVRMIVDRYTFYENNPQHIWVRAFSAWFLYFPLGSLLDREELKRTVQWIGALWIGTMVVLSIVGIYSAWKGILVYTPNNATKIGMEKNRLILAHYCVTSAQNAVLACNLALFTMFSSEKPWTRVLCGVSVAILFVALGLIDGTNGMLTLALLLGMAAFVLATNRRSPRTIRGFTVGLAAALVVMLVCYNVNTKVLDCFDIGPSRPVYVDQLLHPSQEEPFPTADGQPVVGAPQEPEFSDDLQDVRDLSHLKIDSSLHGRTQIWKSTLKSLLSNEKNVLLFGCTPYGFAELIQTPELPYQVPTAHSMYLQVVLEWGLPGLIILVALLFRFGKSALRLLFGRGIPMWERFVPCMGFAFLFSELADYFSDLNSDTVSLYLLFLFLGMTIGMESREEYIF